MSSNAINKSRTSFKEEGKNDEEEGEKKGEKCTCMKKGDMFFDELVSVFFPKCMFTMYLCVFVCVGQ